MINHVRLVQDNADLVLIAAESLDASLELIGDVQFVGVEEEDDAVDTLSEPFQNSGKVVSTVDPKTNFPLKS